MAEFRLSRRRLLQSGGALVTSSALLGCDQFDFLGDRDNQVREVLEKTNGLTYKVQRALMDDALAPEYSESEIRQGQRPNGSTNPDSDEYVRLRDAGFADYQLRVTGLVEKPISFSLNQLQNMPSRTQITRHDCVEGWSCIAKWTGVPLSVLLDEAGVKAEARYVVFHCFDMYGGAFSGSAYYESCDLIDAYHPQTIAAYGLNGQSLPVANGAPLRVRIERALGYKQPKYVKEIELVESFAPFGQGKGSYWADRGYDWYAGI